MTTHSLRTHARFPAAAVSLLSALAVILTFTGCDAGSDRAQIDQTFDIFARGLVDGDGHTVCAQMTQGGIRTIATDGVEEGIGASCPVVVHAQAVGSWARHAHRGPPRPALHDHDPQDTCSCP